MKLLLALGCLVMTSTAFALTADDIMNRVDQLEEPTSVKANMTMVLIDSKGKQRIRAMQNISSDNGETDKSLMFFLQPADVKGTGFLMFDHDDANTDDDQWMFLPALNKAKRIASSDKTESFMGSDFSYSDMSKRNVEEWTYKILKEDSINGVDVWLIEALPVSDAVTEKTGYVRSIVYVRQDNFQVARSIGYLEKKGEVKLMNISAHQVIQGYWLNTETQMVTQKNGKVIHRTLLKLDNIEVDVDVNESEFTLNRLEQGL
jgi:outer membrane lipoprotein-sorting protein